MTTIYDLPDETLATVFEIGVHAWGTSYLFHVSLVCREWYLTTLSYPHLWGIVDIEKVIQPARSAQLQSQISNAKEAPLDITCHPSSNVFSKYSSIVSGLNALRHNFSRLNIPVRFLLVTEIKCIDIRNRLEVLELHWGQQNPKDCYTDIFSVEDKEARPKLSSFTVHSLPSSWITPFLSPSITYFHLHKNSRPQPSHLPPLKSQITETLGYLSSIPNVVTMRFEDLEIYTPQDGGYIPQYDTSLRIPLTHLQTLELSGVVYGGAILYAIEAPSLLSLVVQTPRQSRWPSGNWLFDWHNGAINTGTPLEEHVGKDYSSLIPFLVEWSTPRKTPTNLHTLEFTNVLSSDDIPILIRFLHRLPNLVRLIISSDDICGTINPEMDSSSPEAQADSNLYYALSHQVVNSSTGNTGWLCPLLTILHLGDVEITAEEVMSIARARGRVTSVTSSKDVSKSIEANRPSILHRFTTQLCGCLTVEERVEIYSLIKEVECTCVNCGFQSDL